MPASTAICAMPAPIVPAPRIPIRSSGLCSAPSAPKEARLPLLAEGRDPLRVIFRSPGDLLERGLHGGARGEEGILGVVEGALGEPDPAGWGRRERGRRRVGRGYQLIRRHDTVDEGARL